MTERQIVALGGGLLSPDSGDDSLRRYILALTGKPRPRVCFLPTASGDSVSGIVAFYDSFRSNRCEPSHLTLFSRRTGDLRTTLLNQDVICVGGGNTANMLAIWRVHGVDGILREAWEAGIVLCGSSAGALCWFEGGSTDSFGLQLAPLHDGLGILPGSFCPHYDSEPRRRETYHQFVRTGLPAGWAADDGAGLLFTGTSVHAVVTARPAASVFRVWQDGDEVYEERLEAVTL